MGIGTGLFNDFFLVYRGAAQQAVGRLQEFFTLFESSFFCFGLSKTCHFYQFWKAFSPKHKQPRTRDELICCPRDAVKRVFTSLGRQFKKSFY
jgi:hypothetical protein